VPVEGYLKRLLLAACLMTAVCAAQDLSPRAYVISPIKFNAVTLSYAFNDGSVLFDPAVPVTGATGTINAQIFNAYHSFGLFGRSANILAILPYAFANFSGTVGGVSQSIYRSGMLDSTYRFSVNLKGGPAMTVKEFGKWQQKLLIGASLRVVAPTGQYDPARLINQGNNRWGFKPEIGVSQRWGKWVLDGYAGIWFFTPNDSFFTGKNRHTQQPIEAFETHLSYDIKPRYWFSVDGNFWVGGRVTLNDVLNINSMQTNSRVGVTGSVPIGKHQSLKASFSKGAYINYGGDYNTISLAWQYSWIGTKFR
jgi:hypothetical protein